MSRNSEVQGTASASMFDRKSAVIGILVVHQLFYILAKQNKWLGSERIIVRQRDGRGNPNAMLNVLTLRGYRSFCDYRMTDFARVNLLVGREQLRQDVHS